MLFVEFPVDAQVQNVLSGSDLNAGIGVSFLYMLLPSIMACTLALPWAIQMSFGYAEIYVVVVLCMLRTVAGITLYCHKAEYSLRTYVCSFAMLTLFLLIKTSQKISLLSVYGYIVECVSLPLVCLPVFLVDTDVQRLWDLQWYVLATSVLCMLLVELMFAKHVEHRCAPNNCMCVALFLLSVCVLIEPIVRLVQGTNDNADAAVSGVLAFGFVFHYAGFRIQEKQYVQEQTFQQLPNKEQLDTVFNNREVANNGDVI